MSLCVKERERERGVALAAPWYSRPQGNSCSVEGNPLYVFWDSEEHCYYFFHIFSLKTVFLFYLHLAVLEIH